MSTQEKVADPEVAKPAAGEPPSSLFTADVALRGLLFASSLTAVVVMVTSHQTVDVFVPGNPVPVATEAKFSDSPAFTYFVVALSVAGLYSIITALASISVISKPEFSASFLLFFVLWDVVMLVIVVSAGGAAGAVGYIGIWGNSHVNWKRVCYIYDTFCLHVGFSVIVSLLAALVLVLLIALSVFSLHKKVPR